MATTGDAMLQACHDKDTEIILTLIEQAKRDQATIASLTKETLDLERAVIRAKYCRTRSRSPRHLEIIASKATLQIAQQKRLASWQRTP